MKLLILICMPVLLFSQPSAELILGSWVNDDPDSRNILELNVRRDGTRVFAHVWKSCPPSDCDWGEAETKTSNGIPLAIWEFGFATVRMQLIPQPNGGLLVAYRSQDNRVSPPYRCAEFFSRRENQKADAAAAEAMVVLRRTAERYRTLPAAYFEASSTVWSKSGRSETRQMASSKTFYLPPDKERNEVENGREAYIRLADGKSDWQIYPSANEYTVKPQFRLEFSSLARFAILDQTRGVPRITGHEEVEGNACTVIKVKIDGGVAIAYWIDDRSSIIRKYTVESDTSHTEVVFRVARLGETLNPELFVYDPNVAHSKDRRMLQQRSAETWVGKPAPDFALTDLDGRPVRLSELRGKVVLLDFWATWCGPCREALPAIEMLHRGLNEKGAVVLGVNSEASEIARQYLAKNGYTFSTLVDTKESVVNQFHISGWPTTILIDREGAVAYYSTGHEPEKLRDALRALKVW